MGFLGGLITGVAVAAGAAAWYMSRSGANVREQYRVEERLGEIGDQLEARTREIQATLNSQIADMRAKGQGADAEATNGHAAGTTLDAASATAAEAAAEVAAETDAMTTRVRKTASDVAKDATD
jgi:gas vesicle protein